MTSRSQPATRKILVVVEPFGGRQRGDIIRDAAELETVYADGQGHLCTQATEEVHPEPDAAPPAPVAGDDKGSRTK